MRRRMGSAIAVGAACSGSTAASGAAGSTVRRRMRAVTGSSAAVARGVGSRIGAASMLWVAFSALMCSAMSVAGGSGWAPGSGPAPDRAAFNRSRAEVSSARYASCAKGWPRPES